MAKAFLSHSSRQKPLIESIANRLGWDNCVVDKYHFEPGEPTLDEIFENIDKSDLFVVFLTNDSLLSEWVNYEIMYTKNIRNPAIAPRLLFLVVDKSVDHTDKRIPQWMRDQYNLKPIIDEVHIYKKIDSKLRDIAVEKYPLIRAKEEIFTGRNSLMGEFESKYYNIENSKPTCIIASGIEEVGRRKFIKHALDKVKKINKFHNAISITLDSRSSVEDFILGIEDLNSKNLDDVIQNISDIDLKAKTNYAKELLLSFKLENEILFIVDKGCIVQPNKEIAGWFNEVISDKAFENATVVALISSIRPFATKVNSDKKYLAVHINELSPVDTRILFVNYCTGFHNLQPSKEISEKILPILNGMPGQIFFAADMLASHGEHFMNSKYEDIKKYNDIRVYNIIEQITKEGEKFVDLMVFISKIGFVSFNTIYQVFGRIEETEVILEKLLLYGVYDFIGIDKEYIQVHNAIADYVQRSKLNLKEETREKLKVEMTKIITNETEHFDISQVILNIKSMLENGNSVTEKMLIPSFVLRSIVDSYYAAKYDRVEELAERILGYTNRYDQSIIREIRYWLCQSLARRYRKNRNGNSEKFFENLGYFNGLDHHFLLGFFYRLNGRVEDAEKSFESALKFDRENQKCRRELVNTLLIRKKYESAVGIARENYTRRPLNTFHIQAYFICLTRKPSLTKIEKEEVAKLLESIKMSHDPRAQEISNCMQAEAKFYLGNDLAGSIKDLEFLKLNSGEKRYSQIALIEIFRKRGMRSLEQEAHKEFGDNIYNDLLD